MPGVMFIRDAITSPFEDSTEILDLLLLVWCVWCVGVGVWVCVGGCVGVWVWVWVCGCVGVWVCVCEGDGDVVGVVTPLRGVAQVVLHGVQVVEVGVRLRVHQDRGVEEDGEGQVEVEREEGEVKERRSCMTMG